MDLRSVEQAESDILYGCLHSDSSSLDACVPNCLAQGTGLCAKRIYIRNPATGKIEIWNDVKSQRAYIYLDSDNERVTNSEGRALSKRDGVRELFVYRSVDREYEHIETLILKPHKRSESSNNSLVYLLVILFCIFIVFIAFALILVYRRDLRLAEPQLVSDEHQ